MTSEASSAVGYALAPDVLLRGQQQVLEMIATGAPLAGSLSSIAEFAERCVPGMMASILYVDPVSRALRAGGYASLAGPFADIVDGLVPGPNMGSCGTCAYTGERIISEDVRTDPLWAAFLPVCEQFGIRSAWSTPLLHSREGDVLGVFGMYYATVRAPTAADLEFVDHFTHLATIAVQRHRDDERQRNLAMTDGLTGIGNRNLLQSRGAELVRQALSEGRPLTAAFLDLDRFKPFNDLFGHLRGDSLLKEVAQAMSRKLAPCELLVRFGGDEFLAVFFDTQAIARQRLEALRGELAGGLDLGDARVKMTFSGGLAHLSPDAADLDTIVLSANEAARRAKQQGGDRCCEADHKHAERSALRRQIAASLVGALDEGRLAPHLQPIVDIDTRRPIAFELLFRADDSFLTRVGAADCIAVAEETGLIHRLGLEMIDYAFGLLADPSASLGGLGLHVNLSVLQLMREGFVADVRARLASRGVNPARLTLELTESQWLDVEGPARKALLALRELGFGLSLDDFGTGYASLTYLQALPFDSVKIDRRFIGQLDADPKGRALCSALLAMGKACGMSVIAEGVESEAQAAALAALGYRCGQGYFWGRPMPFAAARTYVLGLSDGEALGAMAARA